MLQMVENVEDVDLNLRANARNRLVKEDEDVVALPLVENVDVEVGRKSLALRKNADAVEEDE